MAILAALAQVGLPTATSIKSELSTLELEISRSFQRSIIMSIRMTLSNFWYFLHNEIERLTKLQVTADSLIP